jgi:hypothetical protein
MLRTTSRLGAIAASLALMAGTASAAQASVIPPVGPTLTDAHQLVVHAYLDVKGMTHDALELTGGTYKNTTVSAFAIVDRAGQIVAGSNVVGIQSPTVGRYEIRWSVGTNGCATVAMDNSLTPRVLRVHRASSKSVAVLSRRAGASLHRAGFSVAVVC